jgi:hypothetical protein
MKQTNLLTQRPSHLIALILISAILAASPGTAQPRHPAPEVVRSCILKLGVGEWVDVREHTGVELKGEITGIGPQVFQIEQHDSTGFTLVKYENVARVKRTRSPSERGDLSPRDWAGIAVVGGIFLAVLICKATSCTKSAAQALF